MRYAAVAAALAASSMLAGCAAIGPGPDARFGPETGRVEFIDVTPNAVTYDARRVAVVNATLVVLLERVEDVRILVSLHPGGCRDPVGAPLDATDLPFPPRPDSAATNILDVELGARVPPGTPLQLRVRATAAGLAPVEGPCRALLT